MSAPRDPPVTSPPANNPARRRFLNRLTVAAGSIALGATPLISLAEEGEFHQWRGQRRFIRPGRDFFPQSIASFEPRVDSVIVWARVEDQQYTGQDLELMLLVSTDRWLRQVVIAMPVNARAADDGIVQVKLTQLKPRTRYYYRFVYEKAGRYFGSAMGRTQTAPRANDASPVQFALASCQDAIGRYYNAYFAALSQDLDFVIHVGDYIYETTGDPSFQTTGGRSVQFTDLAGAIKLGSAAAPFYAAASISNYRELYRYYRADPVLQRMHERFPFVNIWDDHEFSDDSWQANGTYFDGRRDENNPQRKRNAEQVFFEYIAVDADDSVPQGQVDLSRRALYPDTQLYRDFRYGKNLHLLLTDSRTFRPDHLIPEDAFPGTIVVDRTALAALLGSQGIAYDSVKDRFAPYIDLTMPAFAPLTPVLTQILTAGYSQAGLSAGDAFAKAQSKIQGKLDVRVVNSLLASANIPPIANLESLDRGISFAHMGKTALFSSLGSRYFVVKDTYDLYAAFRALQNPASQDVYDSARAPARPQLEWLTSVLQSTDARWKLIANSTSLTSMVLDLTGQTPGLPAPIQAALALLPAELRNRFYLNVDQFDGFPNYRRALLDLYASRPGVALVAGDIHASFATEHTGGIFEFTGPAVSSFAFRQGVLGVVQADPVLSKLPGLAALVGQLDLLLQLANPQIRYANTGVNGVVVLEAAAHKLSATYWQIDGNEATTSYYDKPLALLGRLVPKRIEVRSQNSGVARSGAPTEKVTA